MFVEELAASPAGHQDLASTINANEGGEATTAGGVQCRHDGTLGAEGESK
ncbi:hypothetical protein GCM10011410_17940 [Hoyosella rhizosphaerae]|uniref:Uncharacterized protein n=1 Tax=Hoyosella rhizosphaerae TaxID=1755582 RepID=A0A916UAJ3_9ACTN|nr:hypothetical protein GCM10011410_17940 [Hoyosella rhizosphaerae]